MAVTDPGIVVQEDPDLQVCQGATVKELEALSSRCRLSRCVKLQKDTYIRLTSKLLCRSRCLRPGSWAKCMAGVDRERGWWSPLGGRTQAVPGQLPRQLAIES